jgi:hypothetical protein
MGYESAEVTGRVYHTENGNVHLEGETYTVSDRALAETLRGIGFVSIAGVTPPVLTTLQPATVVLGAPSFTLHVQGTGFVEGAVIVFAGRDEPTTLVSPTEVTTGVDMTLWVAPDAVPVAVRHGGGPLSNTLSFTFTVSAARRR